MWLALKVRALFYFIAAKTYENNRIRELGVDYPVMCAFGLHQGLLESGPQIEKRTKKIKHPISAR